MGKKAKISAEEKANMEAKEKKNAEVDAGAWTQTRDPAAAGGNPEHSVGLAFGV
ncbi:MAG: hypothetical protein P4M11_04225 [Candidatus Pacebacteria bacterium]|nr:hypothetical protein [Candidatus Paceibacterota bacterium]